MNTTEITHPSHENLAAFNSGRLGVVESAEIERHLADCESCCQLLKTIPDDTLISLLGAQSDTKSEAALSISSQPQDCPRPALDVTIAPGTSKTQTDGNPSATSSTEVPAELQGHPRYRISALLGRGGMGSVYQAEHRLMNRPVALKVIDRQLVQTPGLVERFHREVRAAAKLAHPNIVTAYDAEQAGDLHFLVMELVEGHDLAEVVRQRGKLPVHEACQYVRQAAQGLQHACERGMVHRDIKPQNLMLTAAGEVKILDFGLAHFATEIAETSGLTQVGSMMGTPDYMAPEQARDAHSADIRADIYSLGCTLYCLLSGGAPFPQGSIVEKIMAHVERQPAPLQELRDDVPAGLGVVLAKMMAKSPGDRYQTPAEVAEALLPFTSANVATPASVVIAPAPETTARQPRSPIFIATAVLAMIALIALFGVIVIVTDQGRIEVRSEVDDVDLIVKRDGEQIDIFDTQTGSKVRWFFSGEYKLELKGNRNDIVIHNDGFQLTRWGKEIVTLKRKMVSPTVDKSPDPGESLALAFNGKDSYVVIPSLKYDGDHPLTIEAWTVLERPDGELTGEVLLGNPEQGGVGISATNDRNLSGRQWSFGVSLKNRAGYEHAFEKQKLPRNQLLHLAGVYDGNSEVRFYVNGRLQSRAPALGDHKSSPLAFALGANPNTSDRFVDHFLGRMNEVRISKVARYDKDFTPDSRFTPDRETLALYHFDEGSGKVLTDSSDNGHHGTIVNAKWIAVGRSPETPDPKSGWHGWPKDAPPPAIAPFDSKQAKQHQEAWAKYLGVPVEYTNSIGMKFVLIPPGEFMMGSTHKDVEAAAKEIDPGDLNWVNALKSEIPRHTVVLTQPIYLGVHEVTQAEYQRIVKTNPSHFRAGGAGKEMIAELDTNSFPVEMVNWNDATQFCLRLAELETTALASDRPKASDQRPCYRLPTDAEWEFACRAGTSTAFWFGDKPNELEQFGWWSKNSKGRTHAVGELPANPFGLNDTLGNVWEWVQDGWELTYFSEFRDTPARDPTGPLLASAIRVIRGGDWRYPASYSRCSSRFGPGPHFRNEYIGFRVALSVETVKLSLTPPPAVAPFNAEQAKQHQEAWAKHLGVPVEYTNSIGMKFVLIPPGEFTMGSTPEVIEELVEHFREANNEHTPHAVERAQSEGPQHKVILTQPRYLAIHEVTQAQYEKVMGKNPSHFAATGAGKEAVAGVDTANHPVEMTNWNDAADFCVKLSQKESLKPAYFRNGQSVTMLNSNGYRLPTEAEWEFSCRAGSTTKMWIGDNAETLVEAAWILDNSGNRTHPVGELRSNPFGLCDIHGNVGEWCQDKWELTYYSRFQEQSALDPQNTSSELPFRVARGSSWIGWPYECAASARWNIDPTSSICQLGFRVSLSVEAVKMAIKKTAVKNPVVPTGTNLITDPSLEQTEIGEKYPMGWGTGNLIPPGAYKFSVAEAGKTGKRGWLIEGDGQYAVVPTNRPAVDRALRYAARGWVQLEAGSAQLKILYFDVNGRYIGENRGAITNKRDGWHQLTMLDDLANQPDAHYLSLALTLIGKGKAVFDDLEFTAFDAQKLPPNFEQEYASTSKHDPALFDRWVGRWESLTEYKATAATPAKTVKGETVVRKVLDDRFLLWQWKDESGDLQYLSLLGFDENAGSYHIWVFGSAGEVFERTGQWDAASQTLALDLKSPTPGISGISTDRFTDNDHIESLILVKDTSGQITRDMRATWTRKAASLPAEIDLSGGPAAGSEELALVQKMAGNWTIRSTAKPSVWEPTGKTETFTEQVAWTNGGRFLIFRAYDEAKRMTSLSLMTYEPKESSYHFWTFAKGVYGGQWRITWDASSRAFHWRSIDMPAGWIGTGFNRWIDDDTFDNQALIKDENGRVLLDSTQEKRRRK